MLGHMVESVVCLLDPKMYTKSDRKLCIVNRETIQSICLKQCPVTA
jgi:hypothetical protein